MSTASKQGFSVPLLLIIVFSIVAICIAIVELKRITESTAGLVSNEETADTVKSETWQGEAEDFEDDVGFGPERMLSPAKKKSLEREARIKKWKANKLNPDVTTFDPIAFRQMMDQQKEAEAALAGSETEEDNMPSPPPGAADQDVDPTPNTVAW